MTLACAVATSAENAEIRNMPPHLPKRVNGVHAYAAQSVAAGEEIGFHVSSTEKYRFSLVRLGAEPHSTAKDKTLFTEVGAIAPRPIFPGSYVHFAKPVDRNAAKLTVSCWFRPFRVNGPRQAIIAQQRDDSHGGFGLFLEGGKVFLVAGQQSKDHRVEVPKKVKARRWYHVAASISRKKTGVELTLWLDGKQVKQSSQLDAVSKNGSNKKEAAPLRIGASGHGKLAGHFFDGDVACCAFYGAELSKEQIQKIYRRRGLATIHDPKPLAFWDFSAETGSDLRDATGNGHDGQIVNQGTWMVGGPSFDAGSVNKYDKRYDPRKDPKRGHALRLASDDLYDCRWPIVHRVRIPKNAKSGFYCGRFDYKKNGKSLQHNVTFVVRAKAQVRPAPIVVLAATNTWRAYNWYPFTDNRPAGRHNWGSGEVGRSTTDKSLPSYCLYRDHQSGQPTYKVGLNVPCETGDPYRCYRGSDLWGQWVANERLAHLWLDRHGYQYDVITDMDLHANADHLKGRKVLMILGHSEYWSAKAYKTVERYLKSGGNVVVLSANSVFWRVEFDDTSSAMHCRKFGTGMLGSAWTKPGELYHGKDSSRGGLMRFCGYPGWGLIGLETAGWCHGMKFMPYTATKTEHFLFNKPHKVGLKSGEQFGFFKNIGMVGHEYDVRPSILVKATPKMPPGYEGVKDPSGMTVLAECRSKNKIADYHANENMQRVNPSGVCSEILYWQRPNGGRVFNIGSVAAPWGLYYDRRVGLLVQNVLDHFGVKLPSP